jgi:Dyp-type peroxidase family
MADLLDNPKPIRLSDARYRRLLRTLQGNIIKGHGRDYAVYLFLEFRVRDEVLRRVLRGLARKYVTSAYDQLVEREQFSRFQIPGALFGNLFLTPRAYEKLGFAEQLPAWFPDPEQPGAASLFAKGMFAARDDYHDRLPAATVRTALEEAYVQHTIDALLLLADDSQSYLRRQARAVMTRLERLGVARIVAVEHGEALRNEDEEGIEHFGYVDGRSQPLFLDTDFRDLKADGTFGAKTTEKIEDKGIPAETGRIDVWNPFARLKLALVRDPGVEDPHAFGSYYVFRKLEQNVDAFKNAERDLAKALGLKGDDRERAGAMIVGRFRDGTPLVLNNRDGFIPAQANNFRYDGLDADCHADPARPSDPYGLKCPFQAHIRKVNPRQNLNVDNSSVPLEQRVENDRDHRIVRRGITYGKRLEDLSDRPTHDVGLLFACFQANLRNQFDHMQRNWANRFLFMVTGEDRNQTGLDPVIGQHAAGAQLAPQHWRAEYGGTTPYAGSVIGTQVWKTHKTDAVINGYIKFRGGEFFFAPSLSFLLYE